MVEMSDEFGEWQHLMPTNVGDKRLRNEGKLLLVGSCIDRFPEIVKEFSDRDGGQAVLTIPQI